MTASIATAEAGGFLAADPPFTVMAAPNGARRGKQDHPDLPLTPDELARTAAACAEAGAAALHFHVRDRDGRHSLDTDLYRTALTAIRAAVGDGMVLQVTTEAAGRYGPAEQMALVRAIRPEWVSIAVREIAPTPDEERTAARFFRWMVVERVAPQFITYDPIDLFRFDDWRRRGLVPFDRVCLLFVLGRYRTGERSHPRGLLRFLSAADPADPWMACAFGAAEDAVALTAATLGGHCRVGFENNLTTRDGRLAGSNAELVVQAVDAAHRAGRRLASAAQVRELIAL